MTKNNEYSPSGYYIVGLWGNWYRGKYYDYGVIHTTVPGYTPQEAVDWVKNNPEKMYAHYEKAKGTDGRRFLPKLVEKHLFLDKTFAVKPSTYSTSKFDRN